MTLFYYPKACAYTNLNGDMICSFQHLLDSAKQPEWSTPISIPVPKKWSYNQQSSNDDFLRLHKRKRLLFRNGFLGWSNIYSQHNFYWNSTIDSIWTLMIKHNLTLFTPENFYNPQMSFLAYCKKLPYNIHSIPKFSAVVSCLTHWNQ